MNNLRRRMPLAFAVLLAILLINACVTYFNTRTLLRTTDQSAASRRILIELSQTLSTVQDAETGQRGFLLVGEPTYLAPYTNAVASIHSHLARLQQMTEHNAVRQSDVQILSKLVDAKLAELDQTIQLKREKGDAAALAVVRTNLGNKLMTDIRDKIGAMDNAEDAHLADLTARLKASSQSRNASFVLATLAAVGSLWLAFILVRRDLNDRERAADEAEEQRQLLAVTLTSVGDAVIATDNTGRITLINDVGEEVTGWTTEEAAGRPIEEVFHIINEHSRLRVDSPAAKVLREGKIVGLANHTLLIKKDGTEVPIDDSGAPIKDRAGKILGVIIVFRDVSEAKKAEKARNELLEREKNARAQAEAASRTKDEFLAVLSHELRTPLTPVLATVHALEADPEIPDRIRADLDMIRRNAELEARLIDDLLDLTRVANNKIQLNLETVDVHLTLRNVFDICCSEINERAQQVVWKLEARRHHLLADAARLQQMLWNLLKNASKFTPNGGVITIRTLDLPAGKIAVQVSDTGIGIQSEEIPKLFNAFEQANKNIVRQFGGLGLGLAITRALALLHGGDVTAASEGSGKGSTFTLELPLAEIPAAPVSSPQPIAPAPASRALQILLVEDHEDTARTMARLLRSLQHKVDIAGNVALGVQLALSSDYDLILSDIGLPDGSGVELIRHIRAQKKTPAIALTGFGMEEDIRRSLDAGFSAHLTKPVNFERLEHLINDVAQLGSGNEPAPHN